MSNYRALSGMLIGMIVAASAVCAYAGNAGKPVRLSGQLAKIDGKSVTMSSLPV